MSLVPRSVRFRSFLVAVVAVLLRARSFTRRLAHPLACAVYLVPRVPGGQRPVASPSGVGSRVTVAVIAVGSRVDIARVTSHR